MTTTPSKCNVAVVDFPNIPIRNDDRVQHGRFQPYQVKENPDPALGTMAIEDLYLPNFSLRVTKAHFKHDIILVDQNAEHNQLFGSCFFNKGILRSYLHASNVAMESFHGTHNFKYDPSNDFRHRAFANVPYHILHFSVHPQYLLSLLPNGESWSEKLKEQLARGERTMGDWFPSISIMQERILANILQCPLEGKMAIMMMEASITQLLILQMHSIYGSSARERFNALSRRDLDTTHSLREYLKKNFLVDHSLDNLARTFGTNTTNLMSQFKKMFGMSIFEYLTDLRMEHARLLLESDNQMVCEVARTLGYKNPNHFSTAFKKHFGINPGQLIRA